MTFSMERRRCEWCEATEGLIEGETGNKLKLLVCKHSKACGERWPDVWPAGRVGVYEGRVAA